MAKIKISKEELSKTFKELCENNNGRIISTENDFGDVILTCKIMDNDDFNNIMKQIEGKDGFEDKVVEALRNLKSDDIIFRIELEDFKEENIDSPYLNEDEGEFCVLSVKKNYNYELEPYIVY